MADRKRLGAWLLCAGFILVLLVSSAFLIHEADHDCCGEDCPVCRTMAVISSLVRVFCVIAAAWLLSALSGACASVRNTSDSADRAVSATPVRLKIRMND